jgi:Sec7-like guanine-nucleotide exchange factor
VSDWFTFMLGSVIWNTAVKQYTNSIEEYYLVDVTSCIRVKIHRCFGWTLFFHFHGESISQTSNMQAASNLNIFAVGVLLKSSISASHSATKRHLEVIHDHSYLRMECITKQMCSQLLTLCYMAWLTLDYTNSDCD